MVDLLASAPHFAAEKISHEKNRAEKENIMHRTKHMVCGDGSMWWPRACQAVGTRELADFAPERPLAAPIRAILRF